MLQGGTPGRDSIARRDEEATPSRQSEPIPAPASRPRGLGIEADGQFQLFAAIERKDVDRVFMELARMGGASRKAILLSPSRLNQFRFRTPLMAAAAVADISIFSAVLDACRLIFASSETCEVDIVSVWETWGQCCVAFCTRTEWELEAQRSRRPRLSRCRCFER